MTVIAITIPGVPVPQPRQRHRVITTADGKPFAQNYTPTRDPVNVFKTAIQRTFAAAYKGKPLDGPVTLDVFFLMPRPEKLRRKSSPTTELPCDQKPDLDNLLKSTKDALTSLAWHDDKQIWRATISKRYVAIGEQPRTTIIVKGGA